MLFVKLNIKTKTKITAGSQIHVLFWIISGLFAELINVPSDGVPIGKPNPKNDKPVSNPIFPAKASVKYVKINVLKFGIISLNIILISDVPIVFEAET